jgi:RTX calcium-binding nonapeptide repeat (4 copies)
MGLLAMPALAGAATATAVTGGLELTYEAAPGETNILFFDRKDSSDRNLADPNAPDSSAAKFSISDTPGSGSITPQGECTAPNGSTMPFYRVVCPVTSSLRFELGDGNDQIEGHTRDAPWRVLGEGGSDSIDTGWGDDNLSGGDGDDLLLGDKGDDDMSGARGKDAFSDRSGDNQMSGAGGNDNFLDGDGNSEIDGGARRDLLSDQGGRDRISLGSGNDRVVSRDDEREFRISCGPGPRDKAIIDRVDHVGDDCENVSRG